MFSKKYLIGIACALIGGMAAGQSTSNYVRTWDVKAPAITTTGLSTTVAPQQAQMITQYLDGLGRPVQTVTKQASPLGKDMVSMQAYDPFGREATKYLPFTSTQVGTESTTDGLWKSNALLQEQTFYSDANANNPIKGQGDGSYYYGQTLFESSPLNRVTKTMAPGTSWVNAGKGVQTAYWVNTAADAVRIWSVADVAGSFGTYTTSGIYDPGQLYKNVTEDENGKQVIEFKDKEGNMILKKVQLLDVVGTTQVKDNGLGRNYDGWLCTYYIYDDLNRLRCVIQPQGVKMLSDPATYNWNLAYASGVLLNEQCFRYEYDGRGRMIRKKVPGTGTASVPGDIYMVYDKRDRLVFTQDANMRPKNWWLTTAYDALNRPVMTAMMTYTGTFAQLQSFADGLVLTSSTIVSAQGSIFPSVLTFGNREVARPLYQASQSIEFSDGFASETSAEFVAEIVTGTSTPSTLTVNASPFPSGATYTALTLTYYDDYNAAGKSYNTANNAKLDAGTNPYAETLPTSKSSLTRGAVTASKVWVMEDADDLSKGKWLETVSFYDEKGRVVQVRGDNAAGGTEEQTSRYDFSGKVLCTYQTHYNPASIAGAVRIKTNLTYDAQGRVLTIQKQLNDDAATNKTIAQNSYDELGQLKSKTLGSNLESLGYDYNIRGWLLGMNRAYVKDANSTSKFGFDLGYDKSGIIGSYTPKYNGNIAGTVWKSAGDGEKRKYAFSYDAVNRLTGADFTQWISGSGTGAVFNTSAGVNFSVSNLTYDENGNIKTQNQTGYKITGSGLIDQLTYSYLPNSNKLLNVADAVNDNTSKLGDFKYAPVAKTASTVDYTYDANGNLATDNNKAISTIAYNHLNLPARITTAKGTISYVYDAAGGKQSKTTTETGATVSLNGTNYTTDITTTTTYMGGFVYESKDYSHSALAALDYSNRLQFFSQEEGRTRPQRDANGAITGYVNDYFVKDHLGNVRMVLTDEQKVDKYPVASLEDAKVNTENDYYIIDASKIVANSAATGLPTYTNDNGIGNNPSDATFEGAASQKLYQLNGNSNKTGLGMALKVMAGDVIDIYGKSYWFTANSGGSSANVAPAVIDLLSGALGAPTGVATDVHTTPTELNGVTAVNAPVDAYIKDAARNNASYPNRPKAFINYLFFDEQFRPAGGGFSAVNNTAGLKDHHSELQNIQVPKNGYVYIYVSNESPVNVFFDNLQVVHNRGAILEETHYYPFGLPMAGISSKAAGGVENKKKFVSQEFDDDLGWDTYQFRFRTMDPQIGRFLQIDPLASKYVHNSTYAYAENDVIRAIDVEGLEKYVVTYWYENNKVNRVTTAGIRARDSKQYADMNFKTGAGGDLTSKKVYVRYLNADGSQHANAQARNNLLAAEASQASKAPLANEQSGNLIHYDLGDQKGGAKTKSSEFSSDVFTFSQSSKNVTSHPFQGTTIEPGQSYNFGMLSTYLHQGTPPQMGIDQAKDFANALQNTGVNGITIQPYMVDGSGGIGANTVMENGQTQMQNINANWQYFANLINDLTGVKVNVRPVIIQTNTSSNNKSNMVVTTQ